MLAEEKRDLRLASDIRMYLRPVSIEPGRLRIGLAEGAPAELPRHLAARLQEWTGMPWVVLREDDVSTPTLAEEARRRHDDLTRRAREEPAVQAVLRQFPQARILGVQPAASSATGAVSTSGNDDGAE